MATIINDQISVTPQLTYAGIGFCLDIGQSVRLPDNTDKGKDWTDPNQGSQRKQEVSADLVEELNRLIPFKYLNDFGLPPNYPGRNLGAIAYRSQTGPQPNPTVNIGDWYYPPTASKWSVFRGLASSTQVKNMLLATAGDLPAPLIMKAIPSGPTSPIDSYYTLTSNMYMLPPRCMSEHGGSYDGLYLVTLVDERYWWQFMPINTLRTSATPANGIDTWDSLIDQIETLLNVTIDIGISDTDPEQQFGVDPVYSTPELDSHFWTNQENAAILLDAVAANIGRVVVRNLNGGYNLMSGSDSASLADSNVIVLGGIERQRTAGGDLFCPPGTQLPVGDLTYSINSAIPGGVEVTFPAYVVGDNPVPHFINTRYQNQRPSTWYEESYGAVYTKVVGATTFLAAEGDDVDLTTNPLGGTTTLTSQAQTNAEIDDNPIVIQGQTISTLSIHDTAKALFNTETDFTNSVPINQTDLDDLATQIAQDYYLQQTAVALDEVFPGSYSWVPEGIHDLVWTYSARPAGMRGSYTRVMRTQWNQMIREMQHATPYSSLSATTYPDIQTSNVRGVGGPSVAQTIRDSQWDSSMSGTTNTTLAQTLPAPPTPYTTSGNIQSGQPIAPGVLASGTILSGTYLSFSGVGTTAFFAGISYFPTQNRWKGRITSSTPSDKPGNPPDQPVITNEVILFEGTSGGALRAGAAYQVGIVYRGIDGTVTPNVHPNAANVVQITPDTTYGVNVSTTEKGQFVYPNIWTSGGTQEVSVVPPLQTIQVFDCSGIYLNTRSTAHGPTNLGNLHFSGQVLTYDYTKKLNQTGDSPWIPKEYVWAVPRNSGFLLSGSKYVAQMVGYGMVSGTLIQNSVPVYACDLIPPASAQILVKLTGKTYPAGSYKTYSWTQQLDSASPTPISFTQGPLTGGPGNFPAYDINDVDYPIPYNVYISKGLGPYYLINDEPRIEIIRRVSLPVAPSIYGTGFVEIWDQTNQVWADGTPILILDANA